METSAKLLKALQIFLTEYRDNGFEKVKIKTNDLAKVLEVEPVFKKTRLQKKKTNV